ncbi:MAG TPA: histidine kinase dimerization/phospho-acceptor domain-containing protein [Longimicrobiales bacterium]|nr:histidine kinase dimerization/phospho-acceptor domain-containing protein [Longimicrobiales bacterium]
MTIPDADARRALSRVLLDEVGHEFRTPLSSILGHQELLDQGILGELDDKVASAVGRIGVAALQLTHLVNGAVDLAAIALGDPPSLDIEPVSLEHVGATAADYAAAVGGEDGGLRTRPGGTSTLVTTDVRRLERTLILGTTAVIREAPEASVVFDLPHASEDEEGAFVATWSGPGGEWLWVPEGVPGDPDRTLAAALRAVPRPGDERPPGSWLRIAVAAVTAALIGGALRFVAGDAESRLELRFPGDFQQV